MGTAVSPATQKREFHRRLLSAIFSLTVGLWSSAYFAFTDDRTVAPTFSKSVVPLASQPIPSPRLAYIDPVAALANGIRLPPGRPGLPEYDEAVKRLLAHEISRNGRTMDMTDAIRGRGGGYFAAPYFFVELDDRGGAGRAGNFEAQPGVWVNIKGIGITGEGTTKGRQPGPPLEQYLSHADGSARLDEAFKEIMLGQISDAELKGGAGRIIAAFATGRLMKDRDGNDVEQATIVREPKIRYFQDKRPYQVIQAVAESNARRIMKGDLVNHDNIGAYREFVDYGCTTPICGYVNIRSSQNESFLTEGRKLISAEVGDSAYLQEFGRNLINQMGIPEVQIHRSMLRGTRQKERFKELGQVFRELVKYKSESILLDNDIVSPEELAGTGPWHRYFQSAVADWLEAADGSDPSALLNSRISRDVDYLHAVSKYPEDLEFKKLIRRFVENGVQITQTIIRDNEIKSLSDYSRRIREVAHFKNRDLPELTRPHILMKARELAKKFSAREINANEVSDSIAQTVLTQRYSTTPSAETNMLIHADSKATQIFIPAHLSKRGVARLNTHPELRGARKNESIHFRVSTNGWVSFQEREAKLILNEFGHFFRVDLPHESTPMSWKPVEMIPFVKSASGKTNLLSDGLKIQGPPLVFNERVGLPANFVRDHSPLFTQRGVRTKILPREMAEAKEVRMEGRLRRELIELLLQDLSDSSEIVRLDALRALDERWDEAYRYILSSGLARQRLHDIFRSRSTDIKTVVGVIELLQRRSIPGFSLDELGEAAYARVSRALSKMNSEHLPFYADVFPRLSISKRRPYLDLILDVLKQDPQARVVVSLLFDPQFLALPEIDEIYWALFDRGQNPNLKEPLLRNLSEVNPDKSKVLAARFGGGVSSGGSQVKGSALNHAASDTLSDAVLLDGIRQGKIPADAKALGGFERILERFDRSSSTSAFKVLLSERWEMDAPARDALISRFARNPRSRPMLATALSDAPAEVVKTTPSGEWVFELFKQQETRLEALRILSREGWGSKPETEKILKLAFETRWWNLASEKERIVARSAMLNRLYENRNGYEVLIGALSSLPTAEQKLWVSQLHNGWIHHPRFPELLTYLRNNKLLDREFYRELSSPQWLNHPAQAELFEEALRTNAFGNAPNMISMERNPLIRAMCPKKFYGTTCVLEELEAGRTFKGALRQPEFREAAIESARKYFDSRPFVSLDSPYVQEYRSAVLDCMSKTISTLQRAQAD